jgi:Ser/Thr protein kinase RdoA (MazF antagonist)
LRKQFLGYLTQPIFAPKRQKQAIMRHPTGDRHAPGSIEVSVLECLAESYGINGSLQRLSGENLNYLLSTGEGERYVVKIVDDDMPPEVIEMEFEVLEYAISAGFPLQLPRIIKNKYKKYHTGINIHLNSRNRLLLMSFIDGNKLE